jgi:tetratricopeptide (TPR) repeat protein
LVNELLTRNPEHVAGLRLLARIHWWQRDMEKLRAALERLAESAEMAGLTDDERYALTQLVRLAPDELRFSERLEALGGSIEEDSDTGQMTEEPSLTAVPVFETFETFATSDDATVKEAEFVWNSAEQEPFKEDANASFADLNETEFVGESDSQVTVIADEHLPQSGQEFVVNTNEFEQSAVHSDEQPAGVDAQKVQSIMQQELESVDFYITQGYTDIAIDSLELLQRQFGSHPDIEARRQRLNSAGGATREATKQQQPHAESFATESPVIFATESDFALVEPGGPDASPSQPTVPTAVSPSGVNAGIDSGLAEIFEEFRLEAEGEPESSNEDFETHYNMATAYKEMDLLDDAIREFQTAAGLAKPTDGTARYFQCCNMLGHCFQQKAMPRAAVLWFKKGLEAPGRTPEEYKALQYELGAAYEQMGDLTRAVAAFTEVYGVDVGYRDIADKLQELQSRQSAQKKKKKRS